MKSELMLPIRIGYNFDNGLLLTRKVMLLEEED
jgi:hypothetical protein